LKSPSRLTWLSAAYFSSDTSRSLAAAVRPIAGVSVLPGNRQHRLIARLPGDEGNSLASREPPVPPAASGTRFPVPYPTPFAPRELLKGKRGRLG